MGLPSRASCTRRRVRRATRLGDCARVAAPAAAAAPNARGASPSRRWPSLRRSRRYRRIPYGEPRQLAVAALLFESSYSRSSYAPVRCSQLRTEAFKLPHRSSFPLAESSTEALNVRQSRHPSLSPHRAADRRRLCRLRRDGIDRAERRRRRRAGHGRHRAWASESREVPADIYDEKITALRNESRQPDRQRLPDERAEEQSGADRFVSHAERLPRWFSDG